MEMVMYMYMYIHIHIYVCFLTQTYFRTSAAHTKVELKFYLGQSGIDYVFFKFIHEYLLLH